MWKLSEPSPTIKIIIICNNEKGTHLLIDTVSAVDRNVIKKVENILKLENLTIKCMWNVQTEVKPIIIGVNGAISKSFTKYFRNKAGKYNSNELQITAALGTVHILVLGKY